MRLVGRHYLFCLPRQGQPALILAILHERMDLMTRLKGRLG
jgi:plasmid stabilization system protein ParE